MYGNRSAPGQGRRTTRVDREDDRPWSLSRRSLLAASLPAIGLYAFGAAPAEASPAGSAPPSLPPSAADEPRLRIETDDAGRATIVSAEGEPLVRLDGYRIAPEIDARGGVLEEDDDSDGTQTVRISYPVTADGYTAAVTYTARGSAVLAEWEFAAPEAADFSDGRVWRTLLGADTPEWSTTPTEIHYPATRWVRDARGGVPYRERTTEIYFATWREGELAGAFTIPQSQYPRRGDTSLHAPARADDEGRWRATLLFRADAAVGSARERYLASSQIVGGAILTEAALAVDISHPSTYNTFAEPGAQTFELSAVSSSGGPARLRVIARDFDGAILADSTHQVELAAGTAVTIPVEIDLPGPRSYVFLEATAEAGSDEALARSAAAVLPPHEFGLADQTIVGMGGFSRSRAPGASQAGGQEPREDEWMLWQRLGVRWLRNNWLEAEESAELGIHTAYQPAGHPEQFTDNPEGFQAWLDRAFDLGERAGVSHYELLNEWNMRDGIGEGVWAREYTENWLLPFRAEMDRRGVSAKLNSMGLASWDPEFMDGIREHGGWDALDGVAVHPGRGNFVPDYDPVVWEDGSYGTRWNYFGSIRAAKAYIDRYGSDKELWLTEIYAKTHPNSWWSDDERIAADSTMLTLALAQAVGVTGVHWFQVYDGLWNDKYGVDPLDSEHHYGLLHADRSPKPHLMAFAAAAEVLDGAEFLGWVESAHPDLRGLRFTGPGGPFWILWSRQDGYLNFADHDDRAFYPHPEPWQRHTRRSLVVHVPRRGEVGAKDVIGREVSVREASRDAVVQVSGTPIVVHGDLDPDRRGPGVVRGPDSVSLHDLAVSAEGDELLVSGSNRTGSALSLQVESEPTRGHSIEVGKGEFAVTVPLRGAPGTQIRVLAERESSGQVYRADYYRSV